MGGRTRLLTPLRDSSLPVVVHTPACRGARVDDWIEMGTDGVNVTIAVRKTPPGKS